MTVSSRASSSNEAGTVRTISCSASGVRRGSMRPAATICGVSKICSGGKSRSSASRSSMYASAELVVPRSMPIFIGIGGWGWGIGDRVRSVTSAFPKPQSLIPTPPVLHLHFLSNVELQFPPPSVPRHAPELQDARLGDHGFERHRDDLGGAFAAEGDFHRRQFFELLIEIFDQVTGTVILARSGSEKPELRRLADDQAELAVGNLLFRAFFHAERHHRQRLQRRREAGNR